MDDIPNVLVFINSFGMARHRSCGQPSPDGEKESFWSTASSECPGFGQVSRTNRVRFDIDIPVSRFSIASALQAVTARAGRIEKRFSAFQTFLIKRRRRFDFYEFMSLPLFYEFGKLFGKRFQIEPKAF